MQEVSNFVFENVFLNPFFWGLVIPFAMFFTLWRDGMVKSRELKREFKELRQKRNSLKSHIETSMSVGSKDLDQLEAKLKALQAENDKMKEEVEAAKRTDHGQDRRLFHMYVGARVRLATRTPGFAEAWERTVIETEKEIDPIQSGVGKLVKDWVPAGLTRMLPGRHAHEPQEEPLRLDVDVEPPASSKNHTRAD